MEIIPALEEKDPKVFAQKLGKLAGFASRIQVDFNDGSFAGFLTVRPEDITDLLAGPSTPSTSLGTSPLGASSLELEAHLMVQKPRDYIPKLRELGFKKFIVQYEIEDNLRGVLEQLQVLGVRVGLAIGPETSVFEVEPLTELLDTITIMDIAPGKQGQKFLPAELAKIREIKSGNFSGEVQADGAINEDTIGEVVEAGPDTLVVGSAIVAAQNPQEAYDSLVQLVT